MPSPFDVASHVQGIPNGVFSKFANKISQLRGEIYPLHVGDTYLEPAVGARMEDLISKENLGLHRYTYPQGHPLLVQAISDHYGVLNNQILISAGATAALHVLASTLLETGDEVLILAPYWPLIGGIVTLSQGKAISVPFMTEKGSVDDLIRPYLSERTVAIYVNTPNNPTGVTLSADVVKDIAHFARKHNLWIWADETYEKMIFNQRKHIRVADYAPERTFSAYSFSKAYGMAGNRCGFLIGPDNPPLMSELRKSVVHSFYSAPTASQIAAVKVLECGDAWLRKANTLYEEAAKKAAAKLQVDVPDGSTFLFLDLRAKVDERGIEGFLLDCLDRNLILAPGVSFGHQYRDFVRVCYTCVPPEQVDKGIDILCDLLAER